MWRVLPAVLPDLEVSLRKAGVSITPRFRRLMPLAVR